MSEPKERRARLGLVSYLNSAPIGYGITRGRQRDRFEIAGGTPSGLADALARGEVDLALLPSFEYAKGRIDGRELAIVPRIGISSFGPSESVLLFTRAPRGAVRSVAVDRSSRTSVALLRLLYRKRLRPGGGDPDFVPSPPDLPSMIERCEGALLIGDPALFASRQHSALVRSLAVLDLAEAWRAMTGLPFVFAFWAGPRREDSAALAAALADSLEEGLSRIPELASERAAGDPAVEELVRTYLSSSIRYGLGRDEIRGLETFYGLLVEERLLDGPPPDLVFHRTEACSREPH